MLKRNLSLIALSTFIALPTFAHEFSFGVGALSTTMFSQISYVDTATFGTTNNDIEWSANGSQITGEFYVGYAYNINKGFDIGVEIWYDLDGPEVEQFVVEPRYIKHSMQNAIGVRVVPGFNITPSTRIIGEVGYMYTQMELSVVDLDPTLASQFSSSSTTKNKGFITYGVGLETMVYQNFGFRASYNVLPPQSNSDSSTNSVSITSTDGTVTYSATPVVNFFYVGGILRFGF
jgi:hypothetical protein